jgi:hypothetical protein
MTYTSKKLEQMCKIIESFPKEEHIEILKIINMNNNLSLSENNNGTFIHMEDLNETTLNLIQERITYFLKQQNDFDVIENEKNVLKNNIKITCNN